MDWNEVLRIASRPEYGNVEECKALSMSRLRKSLEIKPALEGSSWPRCLVADGGVLLAWVHNRFASSVYLMLAVFRA